MPTASTDTERLGVFAKVRPHIIMYSLLLVYLVVFTIVLLSLSAYQVRDRARHLSEQADVSMAYLFQNYQEIVRLETDYSNAQRAQTNALIQLSELTPEDNIYWSIMDPILENSGIDPRAYRDPRDYWTALPTLTTMLTGSQEGESLLRHYQQALTEFESYRNSLQTSPKGSQITKAIDELSRATSALTVIEQERVEFEADTELDAGEVRAAARELNDEIRNIGKFFDALVDVPESVLVLVLVLAMGSLGSTIHITQVFLSGDRDRPGTWYVSRTLLGTVTAVAIYILAKSGQLVLDPTKSTTSMSPWFISFLAIVSGLLSGAAIERLTAAGKNMFGRSDKNETERWGIRLESRIQSAGIDKNDLSVALGVPLTKLQLWIDGTESVPGRAQTIIAAWLRLPLREAFTDIKPA